MTSCCDSHDICYGTCGVTQPFCDGQLTTCMEAMTNLPACQTVIDATSLIVDILGCSHFEAAQAESVQRRCHNTGPTAHPGFTEPLSDVHTGIRTAERVCNTVNAVTAGIMANPVGNAACTAVDVVGTGVGLPGICHEALYAIEGVTSVASTALSVVDEHWGAISAVGGAIGSFVSGFRRLAEDACGACSRTALPPSSHGPYATAYGSGELEVADCEALRARTVELQVIDLCPARSDLC